MLGAQFCLKEEWIMGLELDPQTQKTQNSTWFWSQVSNIYFWRAIVLEAWILKLYGVCVCVSFQKITVMNQTDTTHMSEMNTERLS